MNNRIHFFRFLRRRELNELYLSLVLRDLAISMVGIFIPLYLFYELKFPLKEVFIFYLIFSIFFALFTPITAKIANKIGLKYCILISSLLYIIFFGFLSYLDLFFPILIFLAAIIGIANAFFWFSFHADFAKYSDRVHRGQEVGLTFAVSSISSILGPFIGGLVLSIPELGFHSLFIVVSFILISSSIPLFFFKKDKTSNFSFKKFFSKIKFREAVAFTGNGMEGIAAGILWPLFIFMILKKYLLIGSLASVVAIFMIIFTMGVGKLTDKVRKRKVMNIGGILLAISWFIRGFVKTISQVFTITSIGASASTLLNVPFGALTYDRIKKNNLVGFLVLREIFLCVGRILILVVMYFTSSWFIGFFMGGIGSLLQLFL